MNTLLAGLAAAFVAFTAIPAHAAVSDEILLGRFSGLPELTDSGATLVNFVEGRRIVDQPVSNVSRASMVVSAEQARDYYGDSLMLTLGMLGTAGLAFAAVGAASRKQAERVEPESQVGENWRDELLRMLEADLTNFDGLNPSASR